MTKLSINMVAAAWVAFAAGLCACSPKGLALRATADALSGQGAGSFARDDDPELVGQAVPFGLKTMESLADQLPDHVGLRLAMARGFTQYAYAYVQQPADELPDAQLKQKRAGRERALKLYLRARDYGLEGMRLARGIDLKELRGPPAGRRAALDKLQKEDVALAYWTLAPWAGAIAIAKNADLDLVGDLPVVGELLDRCLALDEAYDAGALHGFAITFVAAQPGAARAAVEKHYQRALALGRGRTLSAQVSYAEAILVPAQDKKAFEALLKQVVAFDVNAPAARDQRLANVLAQRRASFLLAHESDLFSDAD